MMEIETTADSEADEGPRDAALPGHRRQARYHSFQ